MALQQLERIRNRTSIASVRILEEQITWVFRRQRCGRLLGVPGAGGEARADGGRVGHLDEASGHNLVAHRPAAPHETRRVGSAVARRLRARLVLRVPFRRQLRDQMHTHISERFVRLTHVALELNNCVAPTKCDKSSGCLNAKVVQG